LSHVNWIAAVQLLLLHLCSGNLALYRSRLCL
jgi:hypothetical protein